MATDIVKQISALTGELIVAHDEYENGLISVNDYSAIVRVTSRKIKALNKRLYGHAMSQQSRGLRNG